MNRRKAITSGISAILGTILPMPTLVATPKLAKVVNNYYAPGDAKLPKVLIPMIRRTFPELMPSEIVGVQPMSGPVGLAHALRYKYKGGKLITSADLKSRCV